jgi:hypothetical protein
MVEPAMLGGYQLITAEIAGAELGVGQLVNGEHGQQPARSG